MPDTHPDLPDGAYPCFLSGKTQEIFTCVIEDDVTEENPSKLLKISDIKQDLMNRKAVCDFSVFKDLINKTDLEEVLIIYDAEFEYGQNFYLCLTASSIKKIQKKLAPPEEEQKPSGKPKKQKAEKAEGEGEEGQAGEDQDDEESSEDDFSYLEGQVFKYEPPTPKEWISLGSEKEIKEEQFVPSRKNFKFILSKPRREFGKPINFTTTNTLIDANSLELENKKSGTDKKKMNVLNPNAGNEGEEEVKHVCKVDKVDIQPDTGLIEKNNLHKLQNDTSCQATPFTTEVNIQTDWKLKKNVAIQTQARDNSELVPFIDEDGDTIDPSKVNPEVLKPAVDVILKALEQNEIGNLFNNDWDQLGVESEDVFGSNADNQLKEYQSFTDLTHSKDKRVSWCEWHPSINGILACAVEKRMSLDDRIDAGHKNITNPSYILIWSFSDPIHPKLLLEAPADVCCFKFCPSDHNIIIGGCFNGQVAIWDIKDYSDKLKMNNSKDHKNHSKTDSATQFGEEPEPETPKIPFSAVSAIDKGSVHKSPIAYVDFVPNHFEFDKQGNACAAQHNTQCLQVMTCASDGYIAVWDLRKQKLVAGKLDLIPGGGGNRGGDNNNVKNALNNNAFDHLDLTWKPLVKIHISLPQQTTFLTPVAFCMLESIKQQTLSSLPANSPNRLPEKVASSRNLEKLEEMSTEFYAGTDDGKLVKSQVKFIKDSETGKMGPAKAKWVKCAHDGKLGSVVCNPVFRDVVLCIGGYSFTIWNLGSSSIENGVSDFPLITAPLGKTKYTCGQWSNTRPSTFYLGTMNGGIEVWDLLERTNEPALFQNVSSTAITNIQLRIITSRQHLLAISDASGTVHILQVPYILRVPNHANELTQVEHYFNREVERIGYFKDCLDVRSTSQPVEASKPAASKSKEGEGDNAEKGKDEQNKLSEEEQAEKDLKFYETYDKYVKSIAGQFGVEAR